MQVLRGRGCALAPACLRAPHRGTRNRKVSEAHTEKTPQGLEDAMIVLGVILLVIGAVAGISILWTVGLVLVAVGAVLWLLGSVGRAVGGRRHYW